MATKPRRDALKGMAFAETFERRVYNTSIGTVIVIAEKTILV